MICQSPEKGKPANQGALSKRLSFRIQGERNNFSDKEKTERNQQF